MLRRGEHGDDRPLVQREALAGVEVDAKLAADDTRGIEDGGEPLLALEHAVAAVGAAPHDERLLG
jgi:hypothetical protein